MTDKAVIVTGGTRGIGFSIASDLADAGYHLAICGTRQETVDKASAALLAKGVKVFAQVANVSDPDAARAFAASVITEFGSVYGLVNNAGITRDNLAMRMKPEEWDDVISTNLGSVFYLTQALLKTMIRAREGRIVNVSSVVASMGNPGQLNYCASKGGVEAMTRSLAREIGSRRITVNAVAPGFIQTDMTAEMSDQARKSMEDQIPLGRLGRPEDIANAVRFLLDESSAYITGQVLHVNGGLWMS